MKAVVYDAPRSFTVADIATPAPGPGMVRFRVELGGVCGTGNGIQSCGEEFGAALDAVSGDHTAHKIVIAP